jgi:hypothetical protein
MTEGEKDSPITVPNRSGSWRGETSVTQSLAA